MEKHDDKTQRYSCATCRTHFDESDVKEWYKKGKPLCPMCGEKHIEKRCAADPHGGCHCALTTHAGGIKFCEVCGKPVCPECGDHDVIQLSRVTGYLQDVTGWNEAKKQELKDRVRTNFA